jgi:hypothetical protein
LGHVFVTKIHKIKYAVGVFDVVSGIILNPDYGFRVLKILLIFSSVGIVLLSNKDAIDWNSMNSFFKVGGVIFGFTVTNPITLSLGKFGRDIFILNFRWVF